MTEGQLSAVETRARAAPELADVGLTPEAARAVLHDLRVHQVELELQNEELREIQQKLEASRARYFDLYDMAPVGYLTCSPGGVIQEANLTAARLLWVQRGALVDQPLTRFILPADQDIYYHHRRALVEAGGLQVCELRMLRHGGDACWVRLESTTTKDATGMLSIRAVVSDISARKRAEETLLASEIRHRTLFEKSRDALMTLAPPDWRFTAGNSTTVAMFGAADEADFLARAPREYAAERQPDGSLSAETGATMIEIALREGSHSYEWTYRSLSGQEFAASVLLTRIELDGQPLLQATVRDETEVKKLHALLSQADRVASMGMLAAGAAHEINNPLTYVLYNMETLLADLPKLAEGVERCRLVFRRELGEQFLATALGEVVGVLEPSFLNSVVERAREALAGTQRIRTIAKAIGTFSRVESSERSRVDLNYAIECAKTMVLNDIKFRAELVLELGKLPAIWASEGKLSQVFLNLLINATQAIDEGNVAGNQIRIRTWADGENVFAEVQDTGKGISSATLQRIFDPFFTTKAVGVGTGLGLPICRAIVTEFGGELSIESELGRGTSCLVRLPIRRGSVSSIFPAARHDVPIRRGRILVVDDESAIRSVLARMLGTEHEIVTAASGRAAQGILEHDSAFDVILCDLMMPELTGMDLHRWLVTVNPILAAKVVFMTGGAFTPNASEYLVQVGNRQLEKPYEVSKLRPLMFELVAKAKRQH